MGIFISILFVLFVFVVVANTLANRPVEGRFFNPDTNELREAVRRRGEPWRFFFINAENQITKQEVVDISWQEVEVGRDKNGKNFLKLSSNGTKYFFEYVPHSTKISFDD